MASVSAIAARRTKVIQRLAQIPGAVVNTDETDHTGKLVLRNSGVNVTPHDILLANTQVLEFLDRVLTPLVARVEALEQLQAQSAKGTEKNKK